LYSCKSIPIILSGKKTPNNKKRQKYPQNKNYNPGRSPNKHKKDPPNNLADPDHKAQKISGKTALAVHGFKKVLKKNRQSQRLPAFFDLAQTKKPGFFKSFAVPPIRKMHNLPKRVQK